MTGNRRVCPLIPCLLLWASCATPPDTPGAGDLSPGDLPAADLAGADAGPGDLAAADQAAASPDLLPAGWDPAIGPYVRGLRVQSQASSSTSPMAWSMINQACQDRTMALQYALARATQPRSGKPPEMVEAALTNAHLQAVLKAAPLTIGSVGITGPLIVDQTLTDAAGAPMTKKPWKFYWPYHHVPAVKLDGTWMALDLSVSDLPLQVKGWAQQLVTKDVTCAEVDYDTYQKVAAYWNIVLGSSWPPPKKEPTPYCAYYISDKPFAWRPDQTSAGAFGVVRTVPFTMEVQLEAFQPLLKSDGLKATLAEIPTILSRYAGQTLQDLCTWVDLKICKK